MNEEQWLEEMKELLKEEPEQAPEKAAPAKEAPKKTKPQKPAREKKPAGKRQKVMAGALCAIAVALIAAAAVIVLNYHIVDFKLYKKDADALDLRGQNVSISHYDKIVEKLPDCEIRWDVPFQGGVLADDAGEVTVTSLTAEDVQALTYLEQLETVHAENCRDYAQLFSLQTLRPEVEVDYSIHFTADSYPWDVTEVILHEVQAEDIDLLEHLPNLETVVLADCGCDGETAKQLQNVVHDQGLNFGVCIGDATYLDTEESVTLEGITEEELALLARLSSMKQLHLRNPKAEPESIFTLQEAYPDVTVTWDVEIAGTVFDSEVTEVDLSAVVIQDLAEVEEKMAYLPNAEKVILGLCGIDDPSWGNSKSTLAASQIENEDLAAYRDRVREDYKVVWTVRLGPSIALRTDKDNFMPNHFGVGILTDSYAYNLRYCEDMVCLDVGHMTLTDISFVEYMPHLKYLILAWTEVQYIEPIRSCKELVFLELDNSCIRDISPLVDCTALEDLNIGNTWPDVTPLTQMPWLKNVYMIFGSQAGAWQVSQALPDTHVVATGNATVGGNWRKLQNYYDMRDCLGMYYMN